MISSQCPSAARSSIAELCAIALLAASLQACAAEVDSESAEPTGLVVNAVQQAKKPLDLETLCPPLGISPLECFEAGDDIDKCNQRAMDGILQCNAFVTRGKKRPAELCRMCWQYYAVACNVAGACPAAPLRYFLSGAQATPPEGYATPEDACRLGGPYHDHNGPPDGTPDCHIWSYPGSEGLMSCDFTTGSTGCGGSGTLAIIAQ